MTATLTTNFNVSSIATFKLKALAWSQQFEQICFLDNNGHSSTYHSYEGLLAVGNGRQVLAGVDAFGKLDQFQQENTDWLFGFLTYDLKNDVEPLHSAHPDHIGLPDLHFFRPEIVIEFHTNSIEIHTEHADKADIYHTILHTSISGAEISSVNPSQIQSRLSKQEYLETVQQIKQHIQLGDIYELNFCQEFFVEKYSADPFALFNRLNAISKAPFSSFYKFQDCYLLCASPERFLKKETDIVISQPIKGTIKRGLNVQEDQQLKKQLYHSPKDRSENVMIVDLVRNDLAKSCISGTVQVEELFGIYSFEQVHQMISTVKGQLKPSITPVEAIKNAFPMGSMTGAPKIRSMELIEKYEKSKRGLYSGAVGYFKPNGDFDFNVVIRSLLYNTRQEYLSFQVGGAIVHASDPDSEYEECLLKAKGMVGAISS